MSMRTIILAGAAIGVLAIGGTLLFSPWNGPGIAQVAQTPAPATGGGAAVERVLPPSQAQIQLSFAPVVKSVAPSVVNVYATRIEQSRVALCQ